MPMPILTEISDDDTKNKSMPTILEGKKTEENGDDDDDVDFEPEVPAAARKGEKGRGKKSANGNTKTAATLRKRVPAAQNKLVLGQKLITEVLKPVGDKVASSPQKKVRKMRASPFNKKSGSVLGRINNNKKGAESSPELGSNVDGSSPSSASLEEGSNILVRRARPQRVNRGPANYVLSDSESAEADAATDSDFDEDEDFE